MLQTRTLAVTGGTARSAAQGATLLAASAQTVLEAAGTASVTLLVHVS